MTIAKYQDKVDQWIKDVGVRYFDVLTNTILLNEEVGEFSGLIARLYGEQSFKTGTDMENAKKKLGDELADVLFVLTCLANQLDIKVEEAIEENFAKKNHRDGQRHLNNPKLSS